MIRKYTATILSFFLFFCSIHYSNATIEEAINATRPDRSQPWSLHDRPNVLFNEYYISARKLACGFRAFGYNSREEAIDAMLQALEDRNPAYINRNKKLQEYIKNDHGTDRSAEDYLKNLKNTKHELSYIPNKNIYMPQVGLQKVTEKTDYTLINAFALLNKVNLYIYEAYPPIENKKLFLAHAFVHDNKENIAELYLLYKRLHYNKLVLKKYHTENTSAQVAENNYLNELRISLQKKEDKLVRQEVNNNNNVINSEDMESEDELIDLSEDEAIQEIEAPEIKFTALKIANFIFNKTHKLGDLTLEQSFNVAHKQANDVFKKENALFARVHLYLKRNFLADAYTTDHMLKGLNKLIQKKGSKSKIKKYRHYASIYKAQILMKTGQFDEAWSILANLNEKKNGYTKAFWVDIAELLLSLEYTPKDMTRAEAVVLGWKFFNKDTQNNNQARQKSSNNKPSNINNDFEFRPDYLKSKTSNTRRSKIMADTQMQVNGQITERPSAQNFTNASPTHLTTPRQNIKSRRPNITGQKRKYPATDGSRNKAICIVSENSISDEINNNEEDINNTDCVDNSDSFTSIALTQEDFSHSDSPDNHELMEIDHGNNFLNQIDKDHQQDERSRKLLMEAKYYCAIKDKKKASDNFVEILTIHQENQHNLFYIQALIGLGHARYEDAVHIKQYTGYDRNVGNAAWYLKALDLLGKTGDITLKVQALIGLGNAMYKDAVHIKQYTGYDGNLRDAAWYLKALDLLGKTGDITLKVQALIGLGHARYEDTVHIKQYTGYDGNLRDAAWYLKALDLLGETGDATSKVQALIGLGNAIYKDAVHIKQYTGYDRNVGNAAWYLKALDFLGETGDVTSKVQALIGLGNAIYKDAVHIKQYTGYDRNVGNAAWYLKALDLLGKTGFVE